MIVIAGPPGSGKSSRFPLSAFGVEWFKGTRFDIATLREAMMPRPTY